MHCSALIPRLYLTEAFPKHVKSFSVLEKTPRHHEQLACITPRPGWASLLSSSALTHTFRNRLSVPPSSSPFSFSVLTERLSLPPGTFFPRDVLPFTLKLPEAIASARTSADLKEVAKLGAGLSSDFLINIHMGSEHALGVNVSCEEVVSSLQCSTR